MGLFTPIWMKEKLNDKQLEKAQRAVRRINDQNRLYMFVAGNKGFWKVKICAIGQITDQSLLADLACMRINANVRFAALKALQDREQIIRVAAESEWMQSSRGRYPVNMDALDKLPKEDYEAFAAILQRTEIEEIRFEAARRA